MTPSTTAFVFQHNWFNHLTGKLWAEYLMRYKPSISRYLECGVAEGQSMLWVLKNLLDDKPEGYAVGVDPFLDARSWHSGEGDAHRANAVGNLTALLGGKPVSFTNGMYLWGIRADGKERPVICELHQQPSQAYLKIEHREFDMAYVDGNHEAPKAMLDILLCFGLLREGGLLVVDDYERYMRGGMPQVRPAVNAFMSTHRGYFDVVYEHPKQIAFIKRKKLRRRGDYPPTLIAVPSIEPSGDTG